MARAVHMQNHVVLAAPVRHGLNRSPADDQINHDDVRAQGLCKLSARIHLFHICGSHIQIVTFNLTGVCLCSVNGFHTKQEAIAPVHERLAINILIVFGEIQSTGQTFVDHAAVIFTGQAELGLHRRTQQRAAKFIEALALDNNAGRRAFKGFYIGHWNTNIFQTPGFQWFEREHITDQRCGHVRDRTFLKQNNVVGDVREILGLFTSAFAGAGYQINTIRLGLITLVCGEQIGPHHGPCRRG